jgi:hypothetical protein
MRRWSEALVAALAAVPAHAATPPGPTAPSLARLSLAEQRVERSSPRGWAEVREGTMVRLGEQVRTGPDSLARLELPWMAMTLGPASTVGFPDDRLLSAVLDQGRVLLQADAREILKVVTDEAEVRGRGHVVVRRQAGRTLVSSLAGRFLVTAAGRTVALPAGTGTIVNTRNPPRPPVALAEPPDGLSPGSDARFVAPGDPVSLTWTARAAAHQVEVLPVGAEQVLIQRDVGAPPWRLVIPWPGAFRWRVAARDEDGLEGKPSADGLICTDR